VPVTGQDEGSVRFPLDDLEEVAEVPAEEVDAVRHPGTDPGGRFRGGRVVDDVDPFGQVGEVVDVGEDVLDGTVDVGAGLDADHGGPFCWGREAGVRLAVRPTRTPETSEM